MRKKIKKIGKFIRNNILGFIIGVIVSTTVGVGAATMFASSDVVYDNSSSGGSSQTVQGALDELYEKASTCKSDKVYFNGIPIYFNPVSGTTCSDYTSSQSTGTAKTGCLKWYIFSYQKSSDTVDMILDHNTTYKVAWNSSGRNASGPSELLTQLQSDTSSWTGVVARTDSYTDPLKGYTIDYSGYRARLIEANEIAKITGADTALQWDSGKPYSDTPTIGRHSSTYYLDGAYGTNPKWKTQVAKSKGASHYAWLFDYTKGCISYGCNTANSNIYGYWTSSASAHSSGGAWDVYNDGRVNYLSVNSSGRNGLRPVITISKSNLS